MSRDAKKAEQRLKALLKEPANKRCVNCDSLVRGGAPRPGQPGAAPAARCPDPLARCPPSPPPPPQGPQYVVSNYNVFVCTVCSGVQ